VQGVPKVSLTLSDWSFLMVGSTDPGCSMQ